MFDMGASHVHLASGNLTEGLRYAELASRSRARHAPTLFFLVIAQARLGKLGLAHQYLQQLLELWPRYNLKAYWRSYPGRDAPHATEFAWALTSAGLPT